MRFEWALPTNVIFGRGRFQETKRWVKGLGKRALIVTSPGFTSGTRIEWLNSLKQQLESIGVETFIFSNIEPNPRSKSINAAARLAADNNVKFVIGFGGGSVMDAAKSIAALAKVYLSDPQNNDSIFEYSYQGSRLGVPDRKVFQSALPIVCIPTVAATSSETDFYSVITDDDAGLKTTVFGAPLQPTLSIIDSELTYSVPAKYTIDGACDMITHVLESYFSTESRHIFQDNLSVAFVKTVVEGLDRVLNDPRDAIGRDTLSWAAAFALCGAFSGRNGDWPVHSLESGLSAMCNNSHGRGLALILPRVMQFDYAVIPQKIDDFNLQTFGERDGLEKFYRRVGAWCTLEEFVKETPLSVEAFVAQATEKAFQVKAVYKKGQQPYLDNVRKIYVEDAHAIFKACV